MKKKIFAVALAAVMAISSAVCAFAATADVTIDAAFTANTGDEALGEGDFDVTYTFHNASNGTLNWENFAVEVFDADGNYITMRADCFGVGAGEPGAYNDDLGTWGQDQKTTWTGAPENWEAWAADMKNADVTVNVKRTGKVLTFTYDIVAGSNTYKFVGTTPEIADLANSLSIHLTGEKVALTNVKFTNNKAASTDPTTAAANGNTATTAAPAANTGDATTTAGMVVVALAAAAAVVVLRKKAVTE